MSDTPDPSPSGRSSDAIEISLGDLFAFFGRNWLILFLAVLLAGAGGYAGSYLVTPEYQATAAVLPEYGSGTKMGGLSDLASLAGISLGQGGSDAIRPDLYPSILGSKPFLLKVLATPFPLQGGKKTLLMPYLNPEAEPLSATQIAAGDTLITLTKAQEKVLINLAERVGAGMDKITGVLTIRVELPDPVLAAAVVAFGLDYLREFVAAYRGGKETEKINFLRKQVAETKQKYQRAEMSLSAYRDRNQNAYTNVAKVEEQRLQGDYLQAQTLYGELARQLESSRLQAMEDAPVLQVLEPPMVPNRKSKPRRALYALGFALLGGFIALLFVLFGREKIHRKLS